MWGSYYYGRNQAQGAWRANIQGATLMAVGLVVGLAFALTRTASGARAVAVPDTACNAGTMNAHSHILEMTESGKVTPGHVHVPEMDGGTCVKPHD